MGKEPLFGIAMVQRTAIQENVADATVYGADRKSINHRCGNPGGAAHGDGHRGRSAHQPTGQSRSSRLARYRAARDQVLRDRPAPEEYVHKPYRARLQSERGEKSITLMDGALSPSPTLPLWAQGALVTAGAALTLFILLNLGIVMALPWKSLTHSRPSWRLAQSIAPRALKRFPVTTPGVLARAITALARQESQFYPRAYNGWDWSERSDRADADSARNSTDDRVMVGPSS